MKSVCNLPWVWIGDFNETLCTWEKVGRREAENYGMQSFRELLEDCEMMDIESKGCAFTWSNNREGENVVKKRLDRAICNLAWRVAFPLAKAFAFLAIGLDHSPILLSLTTEKMKRKKSFKFELFWLESKDCGHIVKENWEESDRKGANMAEKLKAVLVALEKWSRKEFPNCKYQIQRLQLELQRITNGRNLPVDRSIQKEITAQTENLWWREEMY
ncbi:uncharacterized protein LOC125315992 [Rhodamnia argentea]|uniref:Uncharacterized protein LOC125315992 n=1 Tax=Rhodamnia argentea TaxID=178133 RepID=A0ABM3HPQ1_9MYRT|nr:uncharacterized protein LOC125315992 [Rhodamnia argentea]